MRVIEYILSDYFRNLFGIRLRPRTLQLPVTSKCNSQCLTCNIWKNKQNMDIDPVLLREALKDEFFGKVVTVGLNGGEITLYKNYEALLDSVLSLKSLKHIHIISNGVYTKKLLSLLEYTKKECMTKNVHLGFTISIDGVDKNHNIVRGISAAYKQTTNTFFKILEDKERYCNYLEIGCTISKHNVGYLSEIETTFSTYDVPIIYHLAVPNKRIDTFYNADYSVLTDERARILAAEFFFSQFLYAKSKLEKFRGFANYYYLMHKGKKRLASCSWLRRDVTIDENLNFYLCATASEVIGNLTEKGATEFLKDGSMKIMERKIQPLCDSCIHYNSLPSLKGIIIFLYYYLQEIYNWRYKFKLRSKWLK